MERCDTSKLFGTNVKYTINASDSGGNKSFATGDSIYSNIGIGDSNSVALFLIIQSAGCGRTANTCGGCCLIKDLRDWILVC